jgi:hypothetical protein
MKLSTFSLQEKKLYLLNQKLRENSATFLVRDKAEVVVFKGTVS